VIVLSRNRRRMCCGVMATATHEFINFLVERTNMEFGRLCGSFVGEGVFSSLELSDLYIKTMVVGGRHLCGFKNFW